MLKHNMRETARIMGKKYDAVKHRVKSLGLKVARSHEMSFAELSRASKYTKDHGVKAASLRYKVTTRCINRYVRTYKAKLREFAGELTPEEIRTVRGVAYNLAVKAGRPEHGEDFASYCCMERLKRESTKVNLANLWTDYLRINYGDTNCHDGKAESFARHTMSQVVEEIDDDVSASLRQVRVAGSEVRDSRVLAIAEIVGFEPIDKVLWMLFHQEGYELATIAPWFGVTNAGLSLRLTKLLKKVRSRPYEAKLKDVLD